MPVHADYQVASFVRDVVACVPAALSPLPKPIEALSAHWPLLCELSNRADESDADSDLRYDAFRWLGERSPDCGYLVAAPRVSFLRIGDDVRIAFDNRSRRVDDLPAWTADMGVVSLSIDVFRSEVQSLVDRLLEAMAGRLDDIEAGRAKPQIAVSMADLRVEHVNWANELNAAVTAQYRPDIPWARTRDAVERLAREVGLKID